MVLFHSICGQGFPYAELSDIVKQVTRESPGRIPPGTISLISICMNAGTSSNTAFLRLAILQSKSRLNAFKATSADGCMTFVVCGAWHRDGTESDHSYWRGRGEWVAVSGPLRAAWRQVCHRALASHGIRVTSSVAVVGRAISADQQRFLQLDRVWKRLHTTCL
jgi:hypothetical protein